MLALLNWVTTRSYRVPFLALSVFLLHVAYLPVGVHPEETEKRAEETEKRAEETEKPAEQKAPSSSREELALALVKSELGRVQTEMQARIDEEARWFELKYYLVGALLAGFLGGLFLRNKGDDEEPTVVVLRVLKAPPTYAVMAFALLVALTIDLQIRADRVMTRLAALWVRKEVETFLPIKGWENWLQVEGHYHDTDFFAVVFPSHVYAVTLLLYGSYLLAVKLACERQADSRKVLAASFVIVHVAIAASALYNVSVPDCFHASWFFADWIRGWMLALLSVGLGLATAVAAGVGTKVPLADIIAFVFPPSTSSQECRDSGVPEADSGPKAVVTT